jgi:colicin import membrane protein
MQNQFHLRNKNSFFSDTPRGGQNFMGVCLVSLLIHGVFFLGILLMNHFDLGKPLPRAIQVDLVSFVPGPAGGQGDQDSLPEPEKAVEIPSESVKVPASPKKAIGPLEKIAEPVAILKPDISLKSKPKNLKELMAAREKKEKKEKPAPKKLLPKVKPKLKVDPKAALKKAKEKLAQKEEKENQKQLSQALSRMKAAVETKAESTGDRSGQGIGSGDGTGLGKQGYSPLDMYKLILQSAIEQNWVFNDMLARMDQHLEVRVMIKILSSGEIRDIFYETKSGNRYLDESAKKAIKRANPLPKLPKGMASYDVVVIFTPKGLK